ncbi:peroxiredoxin [Paenibacillus oryzae]|uniref:peroxiredoxin n=1 Tax=Paenibacillus oryzae TaxID=1844972 RepID=UPI001B80B4D3|nr:peroxiredoxin [Paenibacillus oryzae]
MPHVQLAATNDTIVDFAEGGLTVVYAYPRTSPASGDTPAGWDFIPGARGCTVQSCAFRDHYAELKELGVKRLFGLSTQSTDYQKEAARRLHLPFPLLSDETLAFSRALSLPLFKAGGMTLIQRLTLIINGGRIEHVFYPINQPEKNASDVAKWLALRNA